MLSTSEVGPILALITPSPFKNLLPWSYMALFHARNAHYMAFLNVYAFFIDRKFKMAADRQSQVMNKGNNKITELRTILQRESQNS
jgi:hypothetical protein